MSNVIVLGWGSLIWDPRELKIISEWQKDGPVLPIEFARISEDGRLTLVRKPNSQIVQVLWCEMNGSLTVGDAIENLRKREGCPTSEPIGYIDLIENKSRCRTTLFKETIKQWALEKGLKAVIWTDLGVNFRSKIKAPFSEDLAIKYLEGLEGEKLLKAKKYIQQAPEQIKTSLRLRIQNELKW